MILKEEISSQLLYIQALHVFGRNSRKADTVLENQDASQIHASIRWSGHQWELIDHSRNGTFIDGNRLVANSRTLLQEGQTIRFGPGYRHCWKVENLAPPKPLLISSEDPSNAIVLGAPYFFPNEFAPQASVYCSGQGLWIWQNGSENRVLQDGDLVHLPPHSWRFFSAKKDDVTLDIGAYQSIALANTSFEFTVSLNEEHIVLAINSAGQQINLGERTHHYSLLTLARQRIKDAQRGLDTSAQGWLSMERLSKMLGVEPAHLNMQLFRARAQIAKQAPNQSELLEVIERRRGEVRFAAIPVEIIRGIQLEASYDPALTISMSNKSSEALRYSGI